VTTIDRYNKDYNVGELDHGRSDVLAGQLEKIARFKNLKDFCRVSQNGLIFSVAK